MAQRLSCRGLGLISLFSDQKDGTPIVEFFEVKAFSLHHGRCGIGNQRGEGTEFVCSLMTRLMRRVRLIN